MRSTERLAHLILDCMPEIEGGASAQSAAAEELAKIIEKRFGKPNLPNAGESVGVTLDKLKTAALFFDRVWHPPGMSGAPRST